MIGSLLRFSSGKDGEETKSDDIAEDAVMQEDAGESYAGEDNADVNDSSDNDSGENNQITSRASSDEVIPDNELDDVVEDEPELLPKTETSRTRGKHYTLDELGEITRRTLADQNIEVSNSQDIPTTYRLDRDDMRSHGIVDQGLPPGHCAGRVRVDYASVGQPRHQRVGVANHLALHGSETPK